MKKYKPEQIVTLLRPFPGPGGKSQISTGGGRFPIWSHGSRRDCRARAEAHGKRYGLLNFFDEQRRKVPGGKN